MADASIITTDIGMLNREVDLGNMKIFDPILMIAYV